ncbi:MAG TPA: glycosyltransferase family 39 protein, partial [Blastocatellia bacterium]
PNQFNSSSDARMLVHPPGFGILLAALYAAFGESDKPMKLVQVICDAAAAAMIVLIASQLFPLLVAVIAGLFVAMSPHLSYYSLWLGPDTLAVLPILIAIFLIIKAIKRPCLGTVIVAGAFLGLSCWLRSNALLLAPFLAVVMALLFERGKRLRYSAALIGAVVIVISPITIRNLILYRHLIPLSLGAGITMEEGIADYDREHRLGMPLTDEEVARMEAESSGQPDYAGNQWVPDGVERDRARLVRGIAAIRSNPVWFLGVMIRRAGFMLRYNDSGPKDWPLGTATAPAVSAEATFSHDFEVSDKQPIWSSLAGDLIAGATFKSPRAEISIADDGDALRLKGDTSDFGDQLASANIAVEKNTDYLLILPIKLEEGHMAARVTTPDLRAALASVTVPDADIEEKKWRKRKAKRGEAVIDSTEQRPISLVKLPFASGSRTEVRLVISNNGQSPVRPLAQVGRAELFAMGPTPFLWTRYPRGIIRGIQRNLYRTGCILSLIIIGVVLLTTARRWRELAILLAVPLYYMCAQSALHTEYRYILAIHYFLFVIAAVMIGCLWILLGRSARRLSHPFRQAL